MTCPEFDWKGYVLEEIPAPEMRRMEEHLETCAACREELEGLRLTATALRRLPEREIPRRISFVAETAARPPWWQRFWDSAPQLGFASAAMLALAIMTHGVVTRPAAVVAPAQTEAQVQTQVRAQLQPAVADLSAKLEELRRQVSEQRNTDLRDVDSAFNLLEKKMNTIVLTSARMGGD